MRNDKIYIVKNKKRDTKVTIIEHGASKITFCETKQMKQKDLTKQARTQFTARAHVELRIYYNVLLKPSLRYL